MAINKLGGFILLFSFIFILTAQLQFLDQSNNKDYLYCASAGDDLQPYIFDKDGCNALLPSCDKDPDVESGEVDECIFNSEGSCKCGDQKVCIPAAGNDQEEEEVKEEQSSLEPIDVYDQDVSLEEYLAIHDKIYGKIDECNALLQDCRGDPTFVAKEDDGSVVEDKCLFYSIPKRSCSCDPNTRKCIPNPNPE